MKNDKAKEVADKLDKIIDKKVEEKLEAKDADKVERKGVYDGVDLKGNFSVKDPVIDADVNTEKGCKTFLGGWMKALYDKDLERIEKFYPEYQAKDLSWGSNAGGGFTVPDPVLAGDFFVQKIDRPRMQDFMRNIVADGTRGAIPNIDANAAAAIVGENTTVTADSTLTFAESDFALDKAVVLNYISQELLAGTAIDMIGEVAANQLVAMRGLIENELTDGSNFTDTLDGVAWTQSSASVGAISYGDLKDIYHKLAVEYRAGNTVWIMHPNALNSIMSLTGDNRPFYNHNFSYAPEDMQLFGSKILLNPQAVDTSIWFGALDKALAYVTHKDGIQVSVSDIGGNAFNDVQVGIRTWQLCDSVALTNTTIDGFGAAMVEGAGVIV
tara:strand:+ start:1980 stop:3131 length:1152 start_codon:yes stop_codon:yes gene_type:complete